MKSIIGLFIAFQMSGLILTTKPALAKEIVAEDLNDKVISIVKHQFQSRTLEVDDQTFVYNIHGYACAWPGLLINRISLNLELNHELMPHFGSDASSMAIGIKDPNYRFCHSRETESDKIFGPELKPGVQLPMVIERTIDIRKGKRMNDSGKLIERKLLRETVTIKVNNRELETTAEIILN